MDKWATVKFSRSGLWSFFFVKKENTCIKKKILSLLYLEHTIAHKTNKHAFLWQFCCCKLNKKKWLIWGLCFFFFFYNVSSVQHCKDKRQVYVFAASWAKQSLSFWSGVGQTIVKESLSTRFEQSHPFYTQFLKTRKTFLSSQAVKEEIKVMCHS